MNPNEWVSQLFAYGPYAVLVLFVFWVAPNQTKVFLECNDPKDKLKRSLCGGIALVCWIVVVLMVVFIYRNWPPLTVYQGDLGRRKANIEFKTSSEHLYLSQSDLQGDSTVQWNFAVIDKSNPDPNTKYRFAYSLNGEIKYYALMSKDLMAGYNTISIDPNNPRKLNITSNANGKALVLEPIARNEPDFLPKEEWMTAFAEANDYQYIVEALVSPNSYFQVQGREKLRTVPEEVLEELLAQQNLPDKARQQIEEELKQRSSQ
jgi:hypothetical protein